MNQATAGITSKDKMLAKEKYNKAVNYYLKDEKYNDPDKLALYECEVDGLTINLAQDGLCGFKEIEKHSKNIEFDYKLIRGGMFGYLVWPAYAMSINQMRYAKYKDILDSTLIDIQKFYDIVKIHTEITPKIIADIFEKCDLGRAYIFPNTFYWLRSFENFNDFIKNRNLGAFVDKDENGEFIAKKWTNTNEFDERYFEELIYRTKKYRKQNDIH